MMFRGVFWSLPEPFSSSPRPILRPGRFLVMWALCCFSPAAQIACEVDGGPPECGHERTELRDAAAVFVACHEVMVAARAKET